ncbi:MAG TPA: PIG-L family deacetylase [Trebonia sp.]|jgi:LmbE family N-acetylglucosaminyl deacetylase|nr:PIG-L family deacetylase [Trebonia sp.]
MAEPLTLMAVHAHPDDEASGGGILATYSDEGVRTIVVTCTNGEYGDAPGGIKPGQPGHDPEKVAQLRLAELRESVRILGVSDVETLGYRDSGMPDWEYKNSPDAFSNIPIEVVADRIGVLLTKYRPDVLVTYDDQGAYQHPDHVHASLSAQAAAASTGIPAKVYLSTMRGSSWRKIWDALRAAGEQVPDWDIDEERARRAAEAEKRITTTIDIRPVLGRKREALFAHGSQIDESWFSKVPVDVTEAAFGYEYFIRSVDTTGAPVPETDLFAGLRTGA